MPSEKDDYGRDNAFANMFSNNFSSPPKQVVQIAHAESLSIGDDGIKIDGKPLEASPGAAKPAAPAVAKPKNYSF